jgi:hypothetical protein
MPNRDEVDVAMPRLPFRRAPQRRPARHLTRV